jgi:multidrug efflux pump subunit AcrA (membrane-fusion protein)
VIITAAALHDVRREGKISYIDPQIKADTRTAQLRVEVPNPGRQLRLGMFVDMEIGEGASEAVVTVPRSAVQMVGDRSVVYVANPSQPGQFVERGVETGRAAGDSIEVVRGIQDGDLIVVKGSFAVRAESERLGTRAGSTKPGPSEAGPQQTVRPD